MPRTLSELKQFVPKSSLKNIQTDPTQNSVLGNVKKLHDALGEYNDFASNKLKEDLERILDANEGKVDEEIGDQLISMLHAPLHTVYLLKTGNGADKIEDEQKRKEMRNLIEYVAAGLGVSEKDIALSPEQKLALDHMERTGRTAVRSEQAEEERQARIKAVEGKSALNVLDEHKAAVKAMPKRFTGPDAEKSEKAAMKQLKSLCVDIMSTRRAVEAKRNNKSGLAKAAVDADLLHSIKQDMAKNKALDQFLSSMSYSELRDLASSGHGGAMEDKFSSYLKSHPGPYPDDAPDHYMPTAKERTEALKDYMDSTSFAKSTPPAEQREVYIELMAARMAVNSKRGDKKSLDCRINPNMLDQERQKFKKDPLEKALIRITSMERQEHTYKAAMSGHGGALEDKMRTEIRRMSIEKESGYRIPEVDPRFAPTPKERINDLDVLMQNPKLTSLDKLNAALEAGMLMDMIQADKGNEPVANIASLNRQIDYKSSLYSKIMSKAEVDDFVKNTIEYGHDGACSRLEMAHMGEIKAIQLEENINSQLAEGPVNADLHKLAAQKMVLLQHKTQFQADKDNDKLADALDTAQLEKDVNALMKNLNFKDMCDKLGNEGLMKQAQGDGSKLVNSFALATENKLQPYNPEAPAPVKDGPEKGPQAPQIG